LEVRRLPRQEGKLPTLEPVGPPYLAAELLVGEIEDDPQGISGIACLPAGPSGLRRCLVVNDETKGVQFVRIENRSLVPDGPLVALIGAAPSAETLGRAPAVTTCPIPEPGNFKEFDGEGVAYAAPYFYVVGSHGCSRNAGKFRLSSFLLARFRVDSAGRPVAMDGAPLPPHAPVPVETTYRLSDLLARAPTAGAFFGRGLDEELNGLNVEGIAVTGDRLFVGLRAPVKDGTAFVIEASVADLFAPGRAPSQAVPVEIPLALGDRIGIRDLAPLDDGRLLILAGPAQRQDKPYALFVAEPRPGTEPSLLGALAALPFEDRKGKAEAVAVLGPDRVLILFDSLLNGGPREYRVELS
jgi:hypothetical protein